MWNNKTIKFLLKEMEDLKSQFNDFKNQPAINIRDVILAGLWLYSQFNGVSRTDLESRINQLVTNRIFKTPYSDYQIDKRVKIFNNNFEFSDIPLTPHK